MALEAPPYDARAIANYLLDLAESRSIELTQLSLYKIIYFCHGWYLSSTEQPLIKQSFEAWQYGPVVKVLYDSFKITGKRAINIRASALDIYSGVYSKVLHNIEKADMEFVGFIFEYYHVFDAWQLSEITHEKGSPWDIVWNASEPVGRLGLRLKDDEIKAHFCQVAKKFRPT